jgi:hypothetical protein
MHDNDKQDAHSQRGNEALRLWKHQNVADWTVARYLADAWPDIGLCHRVSSDPILARATVAEVVRNPAALDAFLAQCSQIPECGARRQARIRDALLCVMPPQADEANNQFPAQDCDTPDATSRLRIAPETKEALLRKWAFVLGNALWDIQLFELTALDLRPEEDLVYRTIILASIQRILRERGPAHPVFMGDAPIPPHQITPVSMRRVAEVTGIPRETVRRHVQVLKMRGFVDEHPDGGVFAPNSLRIRVSAGLTDKGLQLFLTAVNSLIDMGVLVTDDGKLSKATGGQSDSQ